MPGPCLKVCTLVRPSVRHECTKRPYALPSKLRTPGHTHTRHGCLPVHFNAHVTNNYHQSIKFQHGQSHFLSFLHFTTTLLAIAMDYTDSTGSSHTRDNHLDHRDTATKEYAASTTNIPPATPGARIELVRQRTEELMRPQRKIGEPPSLIRSLRVIILSSCVSSRSPVMAMFDRACSLSRD